MNAARRKAIEKIKTTIEEAKCQLDDITGEEQDYFDAMPESFQNGETGEKAQEAVSHLEEAVSSLEDVIGALESAVE